MDTETNIVNDVFGAPLGPADTGDSDCCGDAGGLGL